jgi:hypothetical protein
MRRFRTGLRLALNPNPYFETGSNKKEAKIVTDKSSWPEIEIDIHP